MGIRTTQVKGLNTWASELVKGKMVFLYKENTIRTYADGVQEIMPENSIFDYDVKKKPTNEKFVGMFGEEYILNSYTFPDGKVLTEFVQAQPWSSGPVFFIALKDEKGNPIPESLWTEDEICAA